VTIPTFPTLAGLTWPVQRTPQWNTINQKPVSGKDTRLALWTYPKYQYTLQFSYLGSSGSNTDWQTLMGFYNSVNGSALPFHFNDVNDNSATTQTLGTGNGTTTQFNFVRSLGGFIEPTQDVTQGSVTVYNNGTPVSGSAYTFLTDSNWGFTYGIQFNTAPVSGHAITATFTYNWPCRFDDDKQDFNQFLSNFWELKKCVFSSLKVV